MDQVSAAPPEKTTLAGGGRSLVLDHIVHSYGGPPVVNDVSLDIAAGELVALLGPSGCGKTTLLRIVAGFVRQSSGHVRIGCEVLDELPPNRRRTGIVFQNYALFPHMTAAENVGYGLAAQGTPRAGRQARIAEMLALVKMGHLADRFPRQLSGGQQQRVALARALAVEPRVLLLDESFSALDKNLRLDMQIEVRRIQQLAGITTVLVTHDQDEAMSMADRVAVLNGGVLEQVGAPIDIYDRPRSLFVNTFVGTSNLLPGRIEALDGAHAAVTLDVGARLRGRLPPGGALAPGQRIVTAIRPEHLYITDEPGDIAGTIDLSFALGGSLVHEVRLADGAMLKVSEARGQGGVPMTRGTAVGLKPAGPDCVGIYEPAT
jgi:putative spermidine/putrescine transport system ATP-binding protein